MRAFVVRRLMYAIAVVAFAACGPDNPSRGYGYTLSASLGTYSDGTDRLGLSILATLRDPQGNGPDEPWNAELWEGDSVISDALLYEAPGAGSAVVWWLPGAVARPGASFVLKLHHGAAQLSVPLSLRSLDALPLPEPALAADASRLSWPAGASGATALCRIFQMGAKQLSVETAAGECDISVLPPGDYTASIVAFAGDLAAIRADHSDAPELPVSWNASESRLGFVRPAAGGSPVTLRAAGGPFLFGATEPGLAILIDLRDGGAPPSEAWTVEVVGPGLSETRPLRFVLGANNARRMTWSYDVAASAGTYSAVARAGTRSVSTLFTVAAGGLLAAPTGVVATAEATGALSVSWSADAAAKSHFVGVWNEGTFAGGQWVTGPVASFGPHSFAAGETYEVFVVSTDVDLAATAFPARLIASENAFHPATFTAR
jgi:hypothetical protein